MSDTIVIAVAVEDDSLTGTWQGLQTATPSADVIESVMFTYRFMEDQPTVFTDVQGSEAEPCAAGRASTDTVDNPVKATSIDEGRTVDDCVPTADQEIGVYAHAADVCPEAQLMADNCIVNHNDEGPVVRLLQWVAGICGGSWDFAVHGCPEGQLMAGNHAIYQNGLVQWLLRWFLSIYALPVKETVLFKVMFQGRINPSLHEISLTGIYLQIGFFSCSQKPC